MIQYVDVMDPSRVVCPVQENTTHGSTVPVRVFWRQQVGDKEIRVYGGMTNISRGLFLTGEEPEYMQKARIGYIPESKAERLTPKPRKAPPKRREQDEDDED